MDAVDVTPAMRSRARVTTRLSDARVDDDADDDDGDDDFDRARARVGDATTRARRRDDDGDEERSTLERKLREAKNSAAAPFSELDVSMLTFADHAAQLEAIEVSLEERCRTEQAARDRWHDQSLA